jgi:hypothetical protein
VVEGLEGVKVDAVDRDLGKIAGARGGVARETVQEQWSNAARSKGRSEHDCSLILAQFRIFELGLLGGIWDAAGSRGRGARATWSHKRKRPI